MPPVGLGVLHAATRGIETNNSPGKVYFIGAGPGDPDLITLRGRRLIETADLVLYADSLVSPEICRFARPGAEVIGTADQTLETILERMLEACRAGRTVARLHSGDPSLYVDPVHIPIAYDYVFVTDGR